jgi:hypothetical protein
MSFIDQHLSRQFELMMAALNDLNARVAALEAALATPSSSRSDALLSQMTDENSQ